MLQARRFLTTQKSVAGMLERSDVASTSDSVSSCCNLRTDKIWQLKAKSQALPCRFSPNDYW